MKWELQNFGRPGRVGCCQTWKRALGLCGHVGFLWESFQAELLNSDDIGCCPAQWARELANMGRGIRAAAQVFHWISAVVALKLWNILWLSRIF